MTYTDLLDLSYWQDPDLIDYQAIANAGYKGVAIRFTIGDYYSDPRAPIHWDRFGAVGIMRTPYLVVAPADSTGRQISVAQHMTRFLEHFGNREAELPWVLDSELTRDQSPAYITDLHIGLVDSIFSQINRYPIEYTRQSWWDENVNANPRWAQCPLWAARYTDVDIGGPWGDGYFRFRDWQTWHFWQWTSHGRIIPGYPSDLDLDRWNGDEQSLISFANPTPPPSAPVTIRILSSYGKAAPLHKKAIASSQIQAYLLANSTWTAEKVTAEDGKVFYRINPSGFVRAELCVEI
jgi:GH25 family lysozyme M1 (1,4-beta-N-acetylmuramidase)